RRSREVWSSAPLASCIGDQRELADDERLAADVEQAEIELARLVLEDPQPGNLFRQTLGIGNLVTGRDSQEHAKAGAGGADRFATDDDACSQDALNDSAHRRLGDVADAGRVVLEIGRASCRESVVVPRRRRAVET